MTRNRVVSGIAFVLALLLVLIAVALFRTLNFSAEQLNVTPVHTIDISDRAVERLSQAVQIPTISALPGDRLREKYFLRFWRKAFHVSIPNLKLPALTSLV